jgi:hypothetical protein
MDEWIKKFASELGTEGLSSQEVDDLLLIAREVSRRTGERRLAPLATFLAGLAAAKGGRPLGEAVRKALADLQRILPKEEAARS